MHTIRIPRDSYRGTIARKLAKLQEEDELCGLIEQELQWRYDAMKPGETKSFMSHDVARTISRDTEAVRRLIFRIVAGHNGVTFRKPE